MSLEQEYGIERATEIKKKIKNHHVSWNRGKHGVQKYDITGEKNPFYGRHHTEESKQKSREAHFGKVPWNKGRTYEDVFGIEKAEKLKQVMSETRRGRTYEEIHGVEKAKELRQMWSRIGLSRKGKKLSEKTRKKISDTHKILWKNEDYGKKALSISIPNGHELYLDYLLQNHFHDEWKYVGDGQVIIDGLCPDFISRQQEDHQF